MTKDEALKKLQAVKSYMTSGNPIWDVKEIAEAFDMAIEALEQTELCKNVDTISKQVAIDALEKWESESTWDDWCYEHKDEAEKYNIISPSSVVFNLPSARSTGKWINVFQRNKFIVCACSECGAESIIWRDARYCYNCGARMEECETDE